MWWHALTHPKALPLRLGAATGKADGGAVDGWSVGEALYFFATPTPARVGGVPARARPLRRDAGSAAAAVAIPYLLAGYLRVRPPFALVGVAAAAVAAQEHWEGPAEVGALLLLAVLWPTLDARLGRADGRWYGLFTWGAAVQHLLGAALLARTATDAAFVGPWALALWGVTAVAALLAARLFPVHPDEGEARLVRSGLWIATGLLVLFGVTAEIRRYFELESFSPVTAELAAGLAVSAWWLTFAAALILVGFRRAIKPLRVAGLCVAGLAVLKVVLFDLSSLDALYRVGSVFFLALVMLSLAYVYYRADRSERVP